MPQTFRLSKHGRWLYWRLRDSKTNRDGEHVELTPVEFLRTYVQTEPSLNGECLCCGTYRPLISGGYCMGCTAGEAFFVSGGAIVNVQELVSAIPPAEKLRERLNELRAETAAIRKLYRAAEARDTIRRRAGLVSQEPTKSFKKGSVPELEQRLADARGGPGGVTE